MIMRRRAFLSAAPAALVLGLIGAGLAGCGDGAPRIDLLAVLDRTVQAMDIFDKYMKEHDIKKAGAAELAAFADFLTKTMNAAPPLHDKPILVQMMTDVSFVGASDDDDDGEADSKLFTVEIDGAENRLIATDAGGTSTSLGYSGAGFLGGPLLGSLLREQSAAGIEPKRFVSRQITPASSYVRNRSGDGFFGGR